MYSESCSIALRVLTQLRECIHNTIDAVIKHGLILLESWNSSKRSDTALYGESFVTSLFTFLVLH